MLLTFRTVPLVSFLQSFDFSEMLETLINGNSNILWWLWFWFFHSLFKFFQIIKLKVIKWASGIEPNINLAISCRLFLNKVSNIDIIINLLFILINVTQTMISSLYFLIVFEKDLKRSLFKHQFLILGIWCRIITILIIDIRLSIEELEHSYINVNTLDGFFLK